MSLEKKTEKVVEIEYIPSSESEITERVIAIDRISRTVAGGRRIRFRALVVVGDKVKRVGLAVAKANDVQTAIAKAKSKANKNIITVPIVNGTIARSINKTFGAARIILKPAPVGHSVIAGGSIRPILEIAGIKNIVSKLIGNASAINSSMATYLALKELGE